MSYPCGRVSRVTTPTGPDSARPELRAWLPSFLLVALVWGTSFLFIKVGIRELHPLWLTFARVATGALTMLIVLAFTRTPLPRDGKLWAHMIVVGGLGAAAPVTLFGFGEQRVSSVLAGIAIGFLGVLVVLGVWRGVGGAELTGQLMCFAAAMCYAVAIPYQKRFLAGRAGSGVAIVAAQLLVALAMLAIVAPLVAGAPPVPTRLSLPVVLCVLGLGALGTGVAFALNFRVIRIAGASTSASVTYLMPVVATLFGVTILGEHLRWNEPVGALVVLTGVAISQGALSRLRRKAPTREETHDLTRTPA